MLFVILSQILPVPVVHSDSVDPTEWAGAIRFCEELKAMRQSLEARWEKLGRLFHGMDFKWCFVPYFKVKRKENPEILITRGKIGMLKTLRFDFTSGKIRS